MVGGTCGGLGHRLRPSPLSTPHLSAVFDCSCFPRHPGAPITSASPPCRGGGRSGGQPLGSGVATGVQGLTPVFGPPCRPAPAATLWRKPCHRYGTWACHRYGTWYVAAGHWVGAGIRCRSGLPSWGGQAWGATGGGSRPTRCCHLGCPHRLPALPPPGLKQGGDLWGTATGQGAGRMQGLWLGECRGWGQFADHGSGWASVGLVGGAHQAPDSLAATTLLLPGARPRPVATTAIPVTVCVSGTSRPLSLITAPLLRVRCPTRRHYSSSKVDNQCSQQFGCGPQHQAVRRVLRQAACALQHPGSRADGGPHGE